MCLVSMTSRSNQITPKIIQATVLIISQTSYVTCLKVLNKFVGGHFLIGSWLQITYTVHEILNKEYCTTTSFHNAIFYQKLI